MEGNPFPVICNHHHPVIARATPDELEAAGCVVTLLMEPRIPFSGVSGGLQDAMSVSTDFVRESDRGRTRLVMWRHPMVLPTQCRNPGELWTFVAAHVEDWVRKRPCPLAAKAWTVISKSRLSRRRGRATKGTLSLPAQMPEGGYEAWRLLSNRGETSVDGTSVKWNEK